MIIPLKELVNAQENMYELTVAVIRRAYQLTMTGDEEVEANNGKVVSVAVRQILSDKVVYELED